MSGLAAATLIWIKGDRQRRGAFDKVSKIWAMHDGSYVRDGGEP
jgi:hypothetical protein